MPEQNEFEGFKYAYDINLDWDNTATKVVNLVGRNKRVLEFGCGPGHMSKVLAEKMGCRVTGIEIDRDAAGNAEKYCGRVYVLDLDRVHVADVIKKGKFDVLLFADILEHLKAPERLLGEAQVLLDRGGYIVASLPNVSYCGVVAELLSGRFCYRETGLLDRSHLRFFTRDSLVTLFEENELKVDVMETYELPPDQSEFSDIVERLSPLSRKLILQHREANVYQYIIRAKGARETGLRKMINHIKGLSENKLFKFFPDSSKEKKGI